VIFILLLLFAIVAFTILLALLHK